MNHKDVASKIIEAVGGKDNIASVAHCATRLRVMLKDKDKVQEGHVDEIDAVKGSFFNSGQLQIILGTGTVNKVYEEALKLGVSGASKAQLKEDAAKKEGNAFQRAIRTFGDVFVPIIPVLVATGLFMGVRGLLTQPTILGLFGLTPEQLPQQVIMFTQILTDTAFIFLPALIAWSTFRVFGGTPIVGLVLGLMLVSPSIPNAWGVAGGDVEPILVKLFGLSIPVVGYQGSVLPAFIAGIIGSKLERGFRKIVPDALDLLVTPFATLGIMMLVSLLVIGPIFHIVELRILDITNALLALPAGLGGLIIGGLNQVITVTGVHHIFNLLEIQLLANTGANPFNAIITGAIAAQAGACLAVAKRANNKKVKALGYSATISALLGITEPAIFGINLRYFKPFAMGLVGGATAGFVAAFLKLKATGMALTVLPGSLLYLNSTLPLYILVNVIGFSVAATLTTMFGIPKELKENK